MAYYNIFFLWALKALSRFNDPRDERTFLDKLLTKLKVTKFWEDIIFKLLSS